MLGNQKTDPDINVTVEANVWLLLRMFLTMGELRRWNVFGRGKTHFYREFRRQLKGILGIQVLNVNH